MSNIDAPFGLKPVGLGRSSPYNGAVMRCAIQASEATDIFTNDPVILEGTAVLDLKTGTYVPTVVRATAGHTAYVSGSVVEFEPETDESLRYKTDAVTQRFVNVAFDPDQLYYIQADGSVAVTDIGSTADIIYTHAGSTATGFSGAELDTSDIGTGKQLVILGVGDIAGRNDLTAANPVLIVRINNHQGRNLTGV